MLKPLLHHFSSITPLLPEEEEALRRTSTIKEYRKGQHLVREGQLAPDTFFVLKGLLRQYKLQEGEELSTQFFAEGQWVIPTLVSDQRNEALENLIALEDCQVVVGNEEKAEQIFSAFPRLERIARSVMEQVYTEQLTRMSHYLSDSPEQRYLRLLEQHPSLVQRVAQYHLASYIGVKPESLSRIKKRIQLQA
jgi:CRP-like cAMP-binding protein